ncbi:hypothetical protein AKJ51_02705 [candidate division MSBL1 archaeon SCGC-AAA382A20]|uniref:Hydrogenase maturation protease n=1 Tax=candidate division MSBL1 archaeon SCGC-AAA382A20 TaxID=1698280 RepID=A0A133VK84_9EURY|nr:hypothetical protein AKJ51_02705 [candidate division MSBL1 archaeon SCGC-AAA382A20]
MKGVIGVGSIFRGDDGIGVRLVQELRKREKPQDLKLVNASSEGLKVMHHLKNLDKVIIVDAVKFGGDPGEYIFFSPEEVDSLRKYFSPHELGMLENIRLSKELGEAPEKVIIMGIEPDDTSFNQELSSKLKENFSRLAEELFEKIKEL